MLKDSISCWLIYIFWWQHNSLKGEKHCIKNSSLAKSLIWGVGGSVFLHQFSRYLSCYIFYGAKIEGKTKPKWQLFISENMSWTFKGKSICIHTAHKCCSKKENVLRREFVGSFQMQVALLIYFPGAVALRESNVMPRCSNVTMHVAM